MKKVIRGLKDIRSILKDVRPIIDVLMKEFRGAEALAGKSITLRGGPASFHKLSQFEDKLPELTTQFEAWDRLMDGYERLLEFEDALERQLDPDEGVLESIQRLKAETDAELQRLRDVLAKAARNLVPERFAEIVDDAVNQLGEGLTGYHDDISVETLAAGVENTLHFVAYIRIHKLEYEDNRQKDVYFAVTYRIAPNGSSIHVNAVKKVIPPGRFAIMGKPVTTAAGVVRMISLHMQAMKYQILLNQRPVPVSLDNVDDLSEYVEKIWINESEGIVYVRLVPGIGVDNRKAAKDAGEFIAGKLSKAVEPDRRTRHKEQIGYEITVDSGQFVLKYYFFDGPDAAPQGIITNRNVELLYKTFPFLTKRQARDILRVMKGN